MIIRQERPEDYSGVYNLVKRAFATTSDCDGDEQDYLDDLRTKEVFIPELSLVAENNKGEIIGQIVLYEMSVITESGDRKELVLSPISVDPVYFRQGIARTMIEKAFLIAGEMGYSAVFLCGNPNIYRNLGFLPSYQYRIFHIEDKEKNAEWCMVREIIPGSLKGVEGSLDIV